ncbi:hypothetical protein QBC38DRAFT_549702 [Podospora fimiseda]|uniref:Nephrocystin 3-like N-terminal domain-containing protein n=1 Tax=Podospora fimiseda TaxID=252190 RepID=A0AAN6YM85_9PEZI|nr:hypothetical protein QBC38DRAFT_549702 [Podospora fimiseda]
MLYRVTGKPGSGKSTLMKEIFHGQKIRSDSLVANETSSLATVTAGHFFFNHGAHREQKSSEGLLRTLLLQSLRTRPDLVPVVFHRRWALYNIMGTEKHPWTLRELKECFDTLCSLNCKRFKLLFFIDGLDEIQDLDPSNHTKPLDPGKSLDNLLNMIHHAIKRFKVKFCVASRTWTEVDDKFSALFPNVRALTMQELTRRDMAQVVRTELTQSPPFQRLSEVYPTALADLAADITRKANDRVGLIHRSAGDWMAKTETRIKTLSDSFEPDLDLLEAFILLFPLNNPDLIQQPTRDIFFDTVRQIMQKCFERIGETRPSSSPEITNQDDAAARIVTILDEFHLLACNMLKAGCDCASAGFFSYVKAKVKDDKRLLVTRRGRVSLLEHTIFPDLSTVWESQWSDANFLPDLEKTTSQRLDIIQFLLNAYGSTVPRETALGGSLYDAVCKAHDGEMRGKLDDQGWYAQVRQLLKAKGLGSTKGKFQALMMWHKS